MFLITPFDPLLLADDTLAHVSVSSQTANQSRESALASPAGLGGLFPFGLPLSQNSPFFNAPHHPLWTAYEKASSTANGDMVKSRLAQLAMANYATLNGHLQQQSNGMPPSSIGQPNLLRSNLNRSSNGVFGGRQSAEYRRTASSGNASEVRLQKHKGPVLRNRFMLPYFRYPVRAISTLSVSSVAKHLR